MVQPMAFPRPTDDEITAACNTLGWPGLRPAQEEVTDQIFAGKNVIAVLATGGGKSGIFQVPALSRPGLVVVISPLVALMADQVARLRKHGVNAWALNSHCSTVQKKQCGDAVKDGQVKLLYISPERIQGMDPSYFGSTPIQMFAIDEAHCISEWGHDFRPAYMRVGRSLNRFGADIQRVALTATATTEVITEIATVLNINQSNGSLIVHSPDRPNISYCIVGEKVDLLRLVQGAGTPCLIYGSTRRSVEEAANYLKRHEFNAAHYHAGMGRKERTEVQDAFLNNEYDVIAATCAFGMGIDHDKIRTVVHLEMPTSLESYMQETGRAGRDGSPARAYCRFTLDTLKIAKSMAASNWPTIERINHFWFEIEKLFENRPGKWEGKDRIQLTNERIGGLISFDPIEVSSCLRILQACGAIARTPYQDRPVTVTLLKGASLLTGSKQRAVIDALRDHADTEGSITGSVYFFRTEVGLTHAYAKKLNERHGIIFDWIDKCQIIERTCTDWPEIDTKKIQENRRRALVRIKRAEDFLLSPNCRRHSLLSYFGDKSGGNPLNPICCDRCHTKGSRALPEAST